MAKNLSLFEEHSPPEKGLRFSANWWKFYTVYKYDFELYHTIKTDIANKPEFLFSALHLPTIPASLYLFYFLMIKALRKTDEEEVRNLCYVLDNENQRQHLGDQKHIFRVNTLKRLRQALVDYVPELLFKPQVVYADEKKEQGKEIVSDYGEYTYYEDHYTSENYLYGGTKYKGIEFTTKDIELNWVRDTDLKTQIKAYIAVLRICKKKKDISLDAAIKEVKVLS